MKKKYVRLLENRELNPKTGSVWAIQDVPTTWRLAVKEQVESDGFTWDEDGTAIPIPPNED